MKNIIIINHDPLIQRIKDGFCIDYLINKGINVRYLDLSNFYFPKMRAPYSIQENYILKLNTEKEILQFLSNIDYNKTLVICEALPVWKARKIFKLLNKKKAKVMKILIYSNSPLLRERKYKVLLNGEYKKIIDKVFFTIYKKIHHLNIWDTIFSSENSSGLNKINHPDYEKYINSVNDVKKSDKYIVFLDEAFPIHPELLFWAGKDITKQIVPYRKSLIHLFDYLSATFHKEIIICSHPKSNYKGDEFGKYRIVTGQTEKYVRESFFVMMHVSTSISYPILNNKPIFLLSSREYRNNTKRVIRYQTKLSKVLGININEIESWRPNAKDIVAIDDSTRQLFINSYLTSYITKDKHNCDIIYDYINNKIDD